MAYKISGVKSETARVMVLKESDWSIESNTVISGSGAYSIEDLESGKKTTLAITGEDEVIAYGNISPMSTSAAKLWSWGNNYWYGELGLGDSGNRYSSPVQVGALENWDWDGGVVSGDEHTLAVKTDGTLWTWGRNTYGQLGQGTTIHHSSPVQIGSDTDWSKSAGGHNHTLAVKTDGTLWSWGHNHVGQLGLDDTDDRSSPVQVGTDKDWSDVACGNFEAFAIKTSGKLYAWGYNSDGQLGLGYISPSTHSTPQQVGLLEDWSSVDGGVSYTAATKTDGTLWMMGKNDRGQLGLGHISPSRYSSPVQVGGLSDWSQISCGHYAHIAAIKTDGTLWTWGYNNQGQLGLGTGGTGTDESSPVQVGLLDGWSSVSVGYSHTAAITVSGTLWAWGVNGYGQLGQENTTNYYSPVQVGALTTWNGVDCGAYHTLGLE
jgi:alpha-tubulin suppressor-like RCC1 family protein